MTLIAGAYTSMLFFINEEGMGSKSYVAMQRCSGHYVTNFFLSSHFKLCELTGIFV